MTLINYLLKEKIINKENVENAKLFKGQEGSLISGLFDVPGVDEDSLLAALSVFFRLPQADLDAFDIDPRMFDSIPVQIIEKYQVLPLCLKEGGRIVMAVYDPWDRKALDDIRMATPFKINVELAGKSKIYKRLKKYMSMYQRDRAIKQIKSLSENNDCKLLGEEKAVQQFSSRDESALVNLVNGIILDAVKDKASDIHIEPKENSVEVRFRVDGVLYIKEELPKAIQKQFISRMKIMAELDISENRRPQDGRIKVVLDDQSIDTRISMVPTIFGEKAVLRILDTSERKVELNRLGFRNREKSMIKQMIKQPQGLVLVCGPTGSGKTTTLYGVLKTIANKEKNIVTIEDPVEYVIDGINQLQVNEKIGVTFASGLKSILRQDPDCILVGEIRDAETGDMAFRSSLTGHLVFSTLHTNSVFSSVTRLKDIGIEPFIIASSLLGIVSQRLVRCICPHCAKSYQPKEALIDKYFGLRNNGPVPSFYKGAGCNHCNGIGYRDRTVLAEVLPIDGKIRELIIHSASEDEIHSAARLNGFTSMMDDARYKVSKGLTTLDEIERVLGNMEPARELITTDVQSKAFVKPRAARVKNAIKRILPLKNTKDFKREYPVSRVSSNNHLMRYFDLLTGY